MTFFDWVRRNNQRIIRKYIEALKNMDTGSYLCSCPNNHNYALVIQQAAKIDELKGKIKQLEYEIGLEKAYSNSHKKDYERHKEILAEESKLQQEEIEKLHKKIFNLTNLKVKQKEINEELSEKLEVMEQWIKLTNQLLKQSEDKS